jgi:hypothetical protein
MKCPDDGTLQAYLDSELAEAPMRGAAAHLEACASCRDRLGVLEATAGCVHAWLDVLAQGGDRLPAPKTAAARWRWAAVAMAGAAAASLALFLASMPSQKREPLAPTPAPPLANARGSVDYPAAPYRAATVAKRRHRTKPRPALSEFMAFDDADPMQMGMVVRVMLPVSDSSLTGGAQEIAADLVIGEDGRARAIRFVR